MVLTVLSTKLSLAMELSSGDVHRTVQCTVREGVHVGYWAQDKLVHGCCRHSRNICRRCPLPLKTHHCSLFRGIRVSGMWATAVVKQTLTSDQLITSAESNRWQLSRSQ